jgi:hypothetical protein
MKLSSGKLVVGIAVTFLAVGAGCKQSASASASTPALPASQAGPFSKAARTVEVSDPQYGMTAMTLDLPSDWKFAGTVVRDPGCHANGASIKYTAQSADGSTAIVVMPGAAWTWSTSPNMQQIMASMKCPAVDLDSSAKFLVNIAVPNLRPGAKIEALLPLIADDQAAIANQLAAEKAQILAAARQYGQQPPKLTIDGANVRVQYARNGQQVEEMIRSIVDCSESQSPAMYGQAASVKRTCSARGVTIYRAPAGHLDELLKNNDFLKIGKSVQINQAWQTRLTQDQQAAFQRSQAQSNANFQRLMQQGRDANSQLLANGQKFDQQLQNQTNQVMANDQARQAAMDASAHGVANYAADQQDFRNPTTGETIQASSQYNHQWMSSDGGTLIQTNDHSFDPNGQVGPVSTSWTELVPK